MVAVQSTPKKSTPGFRRHPWDHYFYVTFAVASCAMVLFGFGPTYYYRLLDSDTTIPAIVHLHAVEELERGPSSPTG